MTIASLYTGVVQRLQVSGSNILVTIHMESQAEAVEVTLRCSRETAKQYIPGTTVQLKVYATPQ